MTVLRRTVSTEASTGRRHGLMGPGGRVTAAPFMSDAGAPPKDYKDTLNLPRTEFPIKGNLATARAADARVVGRALASGTQMLEKSAGAEPFVLADGPPYANGHLHVGHALNKVLKDIVREVPQPGRAPV